ncbi:MAG: hypothetical protein JWM11_3255 [Planctomycetaceae bacterium]|nr:hypothetical protein [Planctomycetaceae bacterium]
MKLMLILTRWQIRQLFWANCLAMCCATWFALMSNSAIVFSRNVSVAFGVLVHCGIMVLILGRSEPRGPGFLYCQGFSRDQLWWSAFAATVCSGVLVCLSFWLIIATGLRVVVQQALGNPWFPMAGTIEAKSTKWFLMEYILLLPPLHYIWVRARLPQRDAGAGWALAAGILAFDAHCYTYADQVTPSSAAILIGVTGLLALVTLIASWQFHRQTEVQA